LFRKKKIKKFPSLPNFFVTDPEKKSCPEKTSKPFQLSVTDPGKNSCPMKKILKKFQEHSPNLL
jgi:hypothetical protein